MVDSAASVFDTALLPRVPLSLLVTLQQLGVLLHISIPAPSGISQARRGECCAGGVGIVLFHLLDLS